VTKSDTPNFPDILGYITGGTRLNVSVVQLAMAVRPRVVRAGQAFEAVLLIQNASDVEVDVSVRLHLPEQDARKKKDRFITKSERLVIGLRAAEVGYVKLPLSSLPDTAVSDAYKLGMEVDVKSLVRPRRIRQEAGGGDVALEYLAEDKVAQLNSLKKHTFSAEKRGLRGTILEASFGLLSAQISRLVDLKPGWVSLWTLSDHLDDGILLERYKDVLVSRVLPNLNSSVLAEPLEQTTLKRFTATGYALDPMEARFITKLLLFVLGLAAPAEDSYEPLGHERFNIASRLKKDLTGESLTLPSWCRGMLRGLDRNESIARDPVRALAGTLYDELLRDAIAHGFYILHKVTGEQLGSEDDVEIYAERLIETITSGKPAITFNDVYLPLTLAGIVLYDRFPRDGERISDTLVEIAQVFSQRCATEQSDDNESVFKIAEPLLDRLLKKYGYEL
jgi:hypothetical protein